MLSKELLAPKDPTAQEIRDLVDEYVKNEGVIKQCASGKALNFRGQTGEEEIKPKLKRVGPKRRVGTSPKKKKRA